MSDTAQTERNEPAHCHLNTEDEDRIRRVVKQENRRAFAIAGAVLFLAIVGVSTQAAVISNWVLDLRERLSKEEGSIVATEQRLYDLDQSAVKQGEMQALASQLKDLNSALEWMRFNLKSVETQQERLDGVLTILAAAVRSNTAQVSEEKEARKELMEAIKGLSQQIHEGR